MNAPSKIEHETIVNMTSKGQVLIPKVVRDRNGLIPNRPVRIGINERGETVVLPTATGASENAEQRKARIMAAIAAARGSADIGGMTTDDYVRDVRGDWTP